MLFRFILTLLFSVLVTPVLAGNWGGYVSHEGLSEAAACHEARKHAAALCEKNGEFFHVYDNSGTCKLIKTGKLKNKTLFFVNLVFTCHSKEAKDVTGHGKKTK